MIIEWICALTNYFNRNFIIILDQLQNLQTKSLHLRLAYAGV